MYETFSRFKSSYARGFMSKLRVSFVLYLFSFFSTPVVTLLLISGGAMKRLYRGEDGRVSVVTGGVSEGRFRGGLSF